MLKGDLGRGECDIDADMGFVEGTCCVDIINWGMLEAGHKGHLFLRMEFVTIQPVTTICEYKCFSNGFWLLLKTHGWRLDVTEWLEGQIAN